MPAAGALTGGGLRRFVSIGAGAVQPVAGPGSMCGKEHAAHSAKRSLAAQQAPDTHPGTATEPALAMSASEPALRAAGDLLLERPATCMESTGRGWTNAPSDVPSPAAEASSKHARTALHLDGTASEPSNSLAAQPCSTVTLLQSAASYDLLRASTPGAGSAPRFARCSDDGSDLRVSSSGAGDDTHGAGLRIGHVQMNRVKGGVGRRITLPQVAEHLHLSLKAAAEALGVCPTTLKRVCRRLDVPRWPRTRDGAAALRAQMLATSEAAQQLGDDDSGRTGTTGGRSAATAASLDAMGSGSRGAAASTAVAARQSLDMGWEPTGPPSGDTGVDGNPSRAHLSAGTQLSTATE